MAYAVHGDVSTFMGGLPAFGTGTHPTSTEVTAMIVQADALIDNYLPTGATVDAADLKAASVRIVANMITRGRRYVSDTEEGMPFVEALLTQETKDILDRGLAATTEIPLIVSSQEDYQTSSSPDDFV